MSENSTNISNRYRIGGKVKLWDSASTSAVGVENLTIKCNHVGEVLVCVTDADYESVYTSIRGKVIPAPKMQTALIVKREGEKITVESTVENITAAEDLSLVVMIPRRRFINIYAFCDNVETVYCNDIDVDALKVHSQRGEINISSTVFANRYQLMTHNKAIKMKGRCGSGLQANNIDGDIIINSTTTSDLNVNVSSVNGNVKAEFQNISDSTVKASSHEGKVDEEKTFVEVGYVITGEITSVKGNIEYKV